MANNSGVLYISYDGMTDNLGQSQVIPYLEGLSKQGYSIHVLSCEKQEKYEQRKNHISKILQQSSIVWHPIEYTAKPPIISTLYDLHKLQNTAREIILNAENNIKLLHCRSYISAHVGAYCQKKFGLPWIFDMRGFWADERVEGGIWDISKLLYRTVYNYFKNVEKKFITDASYIISLTENGANEIRSWDSYKSANKPIQVIPCCADLQLFQKEISKTKLQSAQKKLNIPDDAFVISYLGSFGTWYMTDEMFDFFKSIYCKNNKAVFLCITPDNPDALESIAMRKDVPVSSLRVVKANREDVPLYASLSRWSMFFIKPVYSKKASSPTKMGELLAMGIPLVCNAGVGDVDVIMQECEKGFVIKDFSENNYFEIADAILQSDDSCSPWNLRDIALKYYSLEKGIQKYAEVYRNILE